MKHYVYIFNTRAKILHIGVCKDIIKALAWYDALPVISTDPNFKLFKLIYLEEHRNSNLANDSFLKFSKMEKKQIVEIIKEVNPTFIELIPGTNIEL